MSAYQDCTIPWDILKDMTSTNFRILADGKEIYKAGKWLL
jgi:hypothetical protein